MFFIPLNQVESVDLVIHALRAAGGEADCADCPARRVCMKQCLSIAEAVAAMAENETLPSLDMPTPEAGSPERAEKTESDENSRKPDEGHLKVIK